MHRRIVSILSDIETDQLHRTHVIQRTTYPQYDLPIFSVRLINNGIFFVCGKKPVRSVFDCLITGAL